MFASRMVVAEPRRFPDAIFLIKRGTSMWVGQAAVHGASKQFRQRFASITAACEAKGGCRSSKRSAISGLGTNAPCILGSPKARPAGRRGQAGGHDRTATSCELLR